MLTTEECPCGTGRTYSNCCAPYHNGEQKPLTSEILMRSRYTAFVKEKIEYLLSTHHIETRHNANSLELASFCANVNFVKLKITKVRLGGVKDQKGTVKFKAFFVENGSKSVISENSSFEKVEGVWYYKSGIH